MKNGLYDPSFEHDSCGIGFVAHIKGKKSHEIIQLGLQTLTRMTHRGAEGADNNTGDGAGILIQIPRDFYLMQGINVPAEGQFATGLVFLPQNQEEAEFCLEELKTVVEDEGLTITGMRDVPRDSSILGKIARDSEPDIRQIFIEGELSDEVLERKLFVIRKRVEHLIRESSLQEKSFFYIPSLSSRVLIYKGLLTSEQLGEYFLDLQDVRLKSAISLVHSRFSTNTFPSWDLAQPFRMLAHNGEINTIKGNRLWMAARESVLQSPELGEDLKKLFPIIEPGMSDSASLDNVLEFLFLSGKSLPHAVSMLVPESWNEKNPISPKLRAFYEYHSTFMEPWDGPAALIFSDGRYIGGTLDRNGLRPSRYVITKDDLIVMGSEVGIFDTEPEAIIEKGKLRPGKMLLVDTLEGKILRDPELKKELASRNPYMKWLDEYRINLEDIEIGMEESPAIGAEYNTYLQAFGYSQEDIGQIIRSMAKSGAEPIGSMGKDTPMAVLSDHSQRLFNYFKQGFAQVTNPAIDPIREELVMSLTGYLGSMQKNPLDEVPDHAKMIKFKLPVINNTSFKLIKNLSYKGFATVVIPMHFDASLGSSGMEKALNNLMIEAENAVDEGKNYIILSDRGITAGKAPIPSLLAVSAVHHHLINKRKRVQIDIVVETAEPREVMHFALLFGYGASIINPYLSFAVIDQLVKARELQLDYQKAEENFIKSINKGLLKILSKMGISTLRSYRAAQVFEAVGLRSDVVSKYFVGTVTRLEGIGLEEMTEEVLRPHRKAFTANNGVPGVINEGIYAFRRNREYHAWNPETLLGLQIACRNGDYGKFKEFSTLVDRETQKPAFLRGFFRLKENPISIDSVEPESEIMKRFVTGAMSYGSISQEAHEALAIAMNRIKGRSNTGEGGENPERFMPRSNGDSSRSAIKQVASGRFGVTANYLVNADEIQIKVAQGAKPGEGGQLPGHKVSAIIAKTRYSIPGITLISPPPHHDIYSIEDLAQLIFDLKNVNPRARISVKLVSGTGVGTIAAGVAKAGADIITISGMEGGTGASPLSSIQHTGLPMEMGISEAQQVLVLNQLRKYVKLQTDGQLKTGLDVVIAGMLGAEEFGFATSALIVLGCVMMRKCHLNTCPVGVATQDPELRKRFNGNADYLVNYFTFLAREVREYMAITGFRKFDDLVGRVDMLRTEPPADHWKAKHLDLSPIIHMPFPAGQADLRFTGLRASKTDEVLDRKLIILATDAMEHGKVVEHKLEIRNTDRSVGTMLSGHIAEKYGGKGLPNDQIRLNFEGSAGQSFGAFLAKGVTLRLKGDANDYLGKGLSGGKIIVTPPERSEFRAEENIIIGNTILYGATSGEVYVNGIAGERFCVRNSGALAVVEGAGDHCCEYMTGGRVVVLGNTGRNFAAGMSGGVAYVLNEAGNFDYFCNMGMVELSLVEDLADIKELKQLIKTHYELTGSEKAGRILMNWDEFLLKFIKVIPYEYKKVQMEQKLEMLRRKIANGEKDPELQFNGLTV